MDNKIFEALSHPLRRRALRLLGERPRMYSELMEELGVDSPTLAFHLKKLAELVEKGDSGFYRLTELGRKALEVMAMVEGAGQPQPRSEAEELTFSDRMFLKIDKALLELAKKDGRKIRVFDVAILEIDKDMPPELFYEVVEEVRDVAVVKVPKHLRSYVEPKARDVGLITERGLLTSTLKLAVQLLGYLGPLKAFRSDMGLADRVPIFRSKRYYHRIASTPLRLALYAEAKYHVSEGRNARDLPWDIEMQFNIGELLAEAKGGVLQYAPQGEVDFVVVTKSGAIGYEVKIGPFSRSEARRAADRIRALGIPRVGLISLAERPPEVADETYGPEDLVEMARAVFRLG